MKFIAYTSGTPGKVAVEGSSFREAVLLACQLTGGKVTALSAWNEERKQWEPSFDLLQKVFQYETGFGWAVVIPNWTGSGHPGGADWVVFQGRTGKVAGLVSDSRDGDASPLSPEDDDGEEQEKPFEAWKGTRPGDYFADYHSLRGTATAVLGQFTGRAAYLH